MPNDRGDDWLAALGRELRRLRGDAGLTQERLADRIGYSRAYVALVETGRQQPSRPFLEAAERALDVPGVLVALHPGAGRPARPPPSGDAEGQALELAHRVAASDVGHATLARLEEAVDDLAVRYAVDPPARLLQEVRRHLRYVSGLVGARATLAEHQRLLVVGGWLSLLAATMHVDLLQRRAARGWLRTASELAREAGHDEIAAWVLETQAWQVLTDGDYGRAVDLSHAAQEVAPHGSSAAIQATAQEGRAWARLGRRAETYDAVSRVGVLAARLERPDRPEHHYRYDPDKSLWYTGSTLAWVGDPVAEDYAREIIARLTAPDVAGRRPRRVASARIDLGLALVVTGRLDEAAAAVREALESGYVVPSNHWRALEVVRTVEEHDLPEATDLREVYTAASRTTA